MQKYLLPKKIAIIYSDAKRKYFPTVVQYITEKSALKDARIIKKYTDDLNIQSELIPADINLTDRLKKYKPDLALNLVGSVLGKEYLAAAIPGILKILNIPYTGANLLGESLAYNKFAVKKVLEANGIGVPKCIIFSSHKDENYDKINYPAMAKLNEIHGSVELTKDALCANKNELQNRIKYLIDKYKQPILVEEFIIGEEFSAIVFDYQGLNTYVARNIFENNHKYKFAYFDTQWMDENIGFDKYNDPKLSETIIKGFTAIKMRDYGKFDVRKDKKGEYFILDANTNPAFGPKENDCAMATVMDMYGISFDEILRRLFTTVLSRKKRIF